MPPVIPPSASFKKQREKTAAIEMTAASYKYDPESLADRNGSDSCFFSFLFCFFRIHKSGETTPVFLEDFSRHELRAAFRNDRSEFHVRKDIFFDINARSDFDQLKAFRARFKYASLRDIESRLTVLHCLRSIVSDLFGLLNELLELTFLIDNELAVFDMLF